MEVCSTFDALLQFMYCSAIAKKRDVIFLNNVSFLLYMLITYPDIL